MNEIVADVANHLGYKMKEKIKDIMAKSFLIPRDKLDDDALLEEDLGVDSLGVFEMIINIEDEYGLELNDKELLKFSTVGEAAEALAKLIEQQVN